MKKIMIIFILLILTGCISPIEFSEVTVDNPRVSFDTIEKNYVYLEPKNFTCQDKFY